jgi:hypothetical protein
VLARAGLPVCRKTKLKNFTDMKAAGGCGVVPFLSVYDLFF